MHEAEGKFRKHESFAGRGFQGLFVGPGRAWKVQAHFTDRGKIFGRMVFARTVIVLVKNDIRNMVQLVFNLPMRADGFPMPAGVHTVTGNIIPVLLTLFSLSENNSVGTNHTFKTGELSQCLNRINRGIYMDNMELAGLKGGINLVLLIF